MADLFVEVFPIDLDSIPAMAAYKAVFNGKPNAFGGRLAYRLKQHFSGQWVWADGLIVTDMPVSQEKIDEFLPSLKKEASDIFKALVSLSVFSEWQPSALAAADFVAQSAVRAVESELREVLKPLGQRIPNGYVLREPRIGTWVIDGMPALSLSARSHLLYQHDLQHYIKDKKPDNLIGLNVMDKTSPSMVAEVKSIVGTLKDHRERLLGLTKREVMQRLLRESPDESLVLKVESSAGDYDYVATSLNIILSPRDYSRFEIVEPTASKAMRLRPDIRAQLVRNMSEVLKKRKIIGNAYSSRSNSHLFKSLDFMPSLEYGSKRVRPYQSERLADDFVKNGLFARNPRLKDIPIRVAVINTLEDTRLAGDFVEAMRRQMEKDVGFSVELIKERNVKVISDSNLASAVRALEKEKPNVILAFFADAQNDHLESLKSQTLGKGIASHAIYETTMNNPDAMALVIMGVLAKTGNIPFVLAEPLEFSQLVVGLDWVQGRMTKGGNKMVGMSRIYRRDGLFMRYFMEIRELADDETIPLEMLQALFPEAIFKGKQIILHHEGTFSPMLLEALQAWGKKLKSEFFPIEISQREIPRLYALENGVTQAPWGSVFLLNEGEAFVISSIPSADSTPRPLQIRVPLGNLPIEQAVYSVLCWTLLHYGTLGTPKLPVSIQNADNLSDWLWRGMLPDNTNGDVPFWL
jgi:hypothetical protein